MSEKTDGSGGVESTISAATVIDMLAPLSYRRERIDSYLHEIATAVSLLTGVQWAAVTMQLPDGREKLMASTLADYAAGGVYEYHGAVAGWVIEHGQPLRINDAIADPSFGSMPPGYRAYLGVPLHNGEGRTMGTICVFHPEPKRFSDEELNMTTQFAERAATAIDNFLLYQRQLDFNNQLEAEVEQRTRQLQETQQRLIASERLAAVGELASGIVHEIRNPLGTLSMALEYVDRQGLNDDASKRVGLALSEVGRLERLLTEILSYARPQKFSPEPCDLGQIARQVVEDAGRQADTRVSVRLDMAETLAPARGNVDKLHQVLLNLVVNAVQASDTGEEVLVTLREGADHHARVSVHNHGMPIRPEHIPRLGEPFFSTRVGGTGLGLAIVHRILEQHESTLQIESTADTGTTMWFDLPFG